MRTLLLAALLLLPGLAGAQFYRWVDESGKVHYSDQAPASSARDLQKLPASTAKASASLPYALQQASANFPVTLYTSEACKESCAQARELLEKRGVPYSEVTISTESDLAQLKQLSGGNAVPVMVVGREVYKGFEHRLYDTALDSASYPASSLLPPGVDARRPASKPVQKAVAAGTEGADRGKDPAQESAQTGTPNR